MARTTTIYLLTGDYADRLDALYARALAAERKEPPSSLRLGDDTEYAETRAEYEALKAEAEAEAIRVTLQAVGRAKWRELREKHPPRTDAEPEVVKQDRLAGVNADSVGDDLVYASLMDPEFKSRAAFDEWADSLSEAEFQAVLGAAWELANRVRVNPKSLPASPTRNGGSSGG